MIEKKKRDHDHAEDRKACTHPPFKVDVAQTEDTLADE
jgi:hypothetical protein